ncbi:MAG: glutathione S-transferase N-terminal domain-containing protein [Labilithrix sp.]|nr:glutathione S-transferase N-terminal domain-containing protein [Labilithrix sp.]
MGIFVFRAVAMLRAPTKGNAVIEFFTFGSTNGHKVAIALEELGFPYEVRTVNIFANEGHSPEFLAVNPTGKIPLVLRSEVGGFRVRPARESQGLVRTRRLSASRRTGRHHPEQPSEASRAKARVADRPGDSPQPAKRTEK